MKKSRDVLLKNKKGKKIFATLFAFFGIIFVMVGAYMIARNHYKSLNVLTYKNYKLFQYIDGQKFEYEGETFLTRENEITKLESKDIVIESNTFPIYYQDNENLVLFPIDMGLILSSEIMKSYKINHFSQIEFDSEKDNANLVYKDKKSFLGDSFLYDGDNLYFFVSPVKLKVGDDIYDLSSGSYAIVSYKERVDIYDRKKDDYTLIEKFDGDVIAEFNEYTINLSTDMIITDEGNRLLVKNYKNLPVYEK